MQNNMHIVLICTMYNIVLEYQCILTVQEKTNNRTYIIRLHCKEIRTFPVI